MGFMYTPAAKAALMRVVPTVDAVDTHMPFVYPTYAAARAAFAAGKPVFYHQRGNFDPARLRFRAGKKKLYIRLIEKPIMKQATTLIALTEAERESFRALGVDTPCVVVPNGIDVPPDRPEASGRIAERFALSPDAQVILFLGRLHPMKGAEKLLDAFARIAAQHPRASLVMAGPDEWGLQSQWRERAMGGGFGGRVCFAGMLTGDDKADMLARADLFALPSIGEGFSIAVLEAMANRTAVLLSPGCHFPEVVAAGAGSVVEADVAAMADELSRLLSQPPLLRSMGDAARNLVENQYSWDVITDRLIDVYAEGIDRAR
jgi:glycosyltransferase involved in cell wall biosynthesis